MKLSLSAIPSALTAPLLDGAVAPMGVELEAIAAKSVDGNSRKMLALAFDVAEMSFATFLKAKEDGLPLIGLPVFTGRRFLQPCIVWSRRAGLRSLSELNGKRVGLPQYWMTSSVWHRGFLRHEYGVRPETITWHTTTPERLSTLRLPPGVKLVQEPEQTDLRDRLTAGAIDAIVAPRPAKEDDGAASPFADVVGAQCEYYRRSGLSPVMHFVVMRAQLDQEHPDLAAALYRAFKEVKALALAEAYPQAPPQSPVHGQTFAQARVFFGGDPWPYGVEPNRRVLETFLDYACEQGLVQRRFQVEELFAGATLRL